MTVISKRYYRAPIQYLLGRRGFRFEDGPFRYVAVPLYERRNRPGLGNYDLEQFPYDVSDRAVVTVDEQQLAFIVGLFRVAGEVNFANLRKRKIREIVESGKVVV